MVCALAAVRPSASVPSPRCICTPLLVRREAVTPRAGYALAPCVCVGLLAVALLLSLLRRAATPPRPSALASVNHVGVVPHPKETT